MIPCIPLTFRVPELQLGFSLTSLKKRSLCLEVIPSGLLFCPWRYSKAFVLAFALFLELFVSLEYSFLKNFKSLNAEFFRYLGFSIFTPVGKGTAKIGWDTYTYTVP